MQTYVALCIIERANTPEALAQIRVEAESMDEARQTIVQHEWDGVLGIQGKYTIRIPQIGLLEDMRTLRAEPKPQRRRPRRRTNVN